MTALRTLAALKLISMSCMTTQGLSDRGLRVDRQRAMEEGVSEQGLDFAMRYQRRRSGVERTFRGVACIFRF